MKAKDLIQILKTSPEAEILMASDEEGNAYSNFTEKTIEVGKIGILIYPYQTRTAYELEKR